MTPDFSHLSCAQCGADKLDVERIKRGCYQLFCCGCGASVARWSVGCPDWEVLATRFVARMSAA